MKHILIFLSLFIACCSSKTTTYFFKANVGLPLKDKKCPYDFIIFFNNHYSLVKHSPYTWDSLTIHSGPVYKTSRNVLVLECIEPGHRCRYTAVSMYPGRDTLIYKDSVPNEYKAVRDKTYKPKK